MHCIIINILTELTLKKSENKNKKFCRGGTLSVCKFIARMAGESSRGKPGLAVVIVVDARGALKQTLLRANDFQLVKVDSPNFAFTIDQNSYHLSSDMAW